MEIKTASGFQVSTTAVPVSEEATLPKFAHSWGGKSELKCDLNFTFRVDFLAMNSDTKNGCSVGKTEMPSIRGHLSEVGKGNL